jgi:hypothetical protein
MKEIMEVIELMKEEGIDFEYVSPNFTAEFAYNRDIELESWQVVELVNNLDNLI